VGNKISRRQTGFEREWATVFPMIYISGDEVEQPFLSSHPEQPPQAFFVLFANRKVGAQYK
jgi:hypothetical protein